MGSRPGLSLPPEVVEHCHVGIHVIQVVGVGGVVLLHPVAWQRAVQVEDVMLWFGFIIHAVEAIHLQQRQPQGGMSPLAPAGFGMSPRAGRSTHMLQEEVQLWVLGRVDCGLVERQEDILQHLLEVGQLLLCPVDVTAGKGPHSEPAFPLPSPPQPAVGWPGSPQPKGGFLCPLHSQEPGHLHEPADVVGVDAVADGPAGQLVPLIPGAAVDRETQLRVLVLALLQVCHHLLTGRDK